MDALKVNVSGVSCWIARAVLAALVAVMLMGLGGCEQKPSAEVAGRQIDQAVDKAGKELDKAAETAKQEVAQVQSSATEKAGEVGKSIDDAKLSTRVKAALIAEPGLRSISIDVTTQDGVVTLHGTAESQADLDNAVRIASRIDGVKSVQNNLQIVRGS